EDWSWREHHLAPARRRILLNQVSSCDVRRHQVGCELDARELQMDDLRQSGDEQRLGETRHADDQTVAPDEQREQDLVDHFVLADDQFLELRDDLLPPRIHAVGEGDVVGRIELYWASADRIHGVAPFRVLGSRFTGSKGSWFGFQVRTHITANSVGWREAE